MTSVCYSTNGYPFVWWFGDATSFLSHQRGTRLPRRGRQLDEYNSDITVGRDHWIEVLTFIRLISTRIADGGWGIRLIDQYFDSPHFQ